jgi:quercetin dioxygenase-like cupin family protein
MEALYGRPLVLQIPPFWNGQPSCRAVASAVTTQREGGATMPTSQKLTTGARVLGPKDGEIAGAPEFRTDRFMVDGAETAGRLTVIEHTVAPGVLAGPLHHHSREDEYSYVLEGKMGALLGDDVVVAEAGDLVFKPRDQWHTFWNAGDEPCRVLEIIAPAGFEDFFRGLDDLGGALNAEPQQLAELSQRYGLEMQPDSVPGLLDRFDLVIGEPL